MYRNDILYEKYVRALQHHHFTPSLVLLPLYSSSPPTCLFLTLFPAKAPTISMGRGKIMVEFFSAEMEFRVCKGNSNNCFKEILPLPGGI